MRKRTKGIYVTYRPVQCMHDLSQNILPDSAINWADNCQPTQAKQDLETPSFKNIIFHPQIIVNQHNI